MTCSHCASAMTDDCRYCPQCGQPTLLGEDVASVAVGGNAAALPRSASQQRAVAYTNPAGSDSVHALLTQANLRRLRKQWTEAVDACVSVLRAQPGNQSAHSLLGDIYRDQGKINDAIQWYRMAVDIWPNASDESKLRQMEQERARLMGKSDALARTQIAKTPQAAISLSGPLVAGTTNLMGVSPRHWLRAITGVSLCFVSLMILWLAGMQLNRHRLIAPSPSVRASTAANSSSFSTNASSLRPNDVASFTPKSSNFTWPQTNASSVVPPESAVPVPIPVLTAPSGTGLPGFNQSHATPIDIPLAPVTKVVPILDSYGQTAQGIGETESASRLKSRLMALTGGLKIAQVYHDTVNGNVALLLTAPLSEEISPQTRALLLRNVYRAAYNEMEAGPALVHATISVQPENEPGIYLIVAELERPAVFAAAINTEAIDSLENRLTSVQWMGQENSANPSGTPAPQSNNTASVTNSTEQKQ